MYYFQRTHIIVNLVLPIIAAVIVVLRFKARAIKNLKFKWDDWTLLMAMILMIIDAAGSVAAVYLINYGELPSKTRAEAGLGRLFLYLHVDGAFLIAIYGLIKVSAILTYKRIFTRPPTFVKVANILLVLCLAWTFAGVSAAMFRDDPLAYAMTAGDAPSFNCDLWLISMTVLDMLLDLCILCMPLPIIRTLQISSKKKWSLVGIFSLGFFCIIASMVRLYYGVWYIVLAHAPYPVDEELFSVVSNSTSLWAHIEACVSIMAACTPALVPLFPPLKQGMANMVSKVNLKLRGSTTTSETSSSKAASGHSAVNAPSSSSGDSTLDVEVGEVIGKSEVEMHEKEVSQMARYLWT